MTAHAYKPANLIAVRTIYQSSKKTIYGADAVEVRRDKYGRITCMGCVRPVCPYSNAVRLHLGYPALPLTRYIEDEANEAIDVGGVRVIPDKCAAVHQGYEYDLGDAGHTNERVAAPPAALAAVPPSLTYRPEGAA